MLHVGLVRVTNSGNTVQNVYLRPSALLQLPILVTASLTIKTFCLYEICNPFGVLMKS